MNLPETPPPEPDKMIRGVSFDLSKTRTGIVNWRNQEPVSCLSYSFHRSLDTGAMLAAFRHMLSDVMPPQSVEWVAFEDVRPVNKNHSEIHFGMVGVLAETCHRRDIPLIRATSSRVKKALAGNGRADKDAMVQAARERYPGCAVTNHDEADALGVGLVAVELIDWEGNEIPDPKELEVPF